ncbi:MAG: hypothetical protein JKY22_05010 [Flavobacteriaceae bacterium]|nr:hypothetical protein [Flavobacteriaceae bacterium]
MSLKNLLFVTITLFLFQIATAQRNYDHNNHLGLIGGIGFFDINTSDFETEQGTGYIFAFTTRGAFFNNIDLIYGLNFIQNQVGILANNLIDPTSNFQSQYVNYTMQSVQINLLGSLNIINNHLSIEAGPVLNVNGKLKIDREEFENFTVEGYDTITSGDLENVSRVHFHVAAGITAGIENFRVGAMYQYGVTNLFSRFNDSETLIVPEGKTFKGNTSTILVTATLYL